MVQPAVLFAARVTAPAAALLTKLVTTSGAAGLAPSLKRLRFAPPARVSVPMVRAAPPRPSLLEMMPPVAAPTFTVVNVPLPVSVPWVRVTVGATATLLVSTNLAPEPLTVMPPEAFTDPEPLRARAPLLTEVAPVKVLVLLIVTAPAVVLFRPVVPPRIAPTEPLRSSKSAALVSTPVVPVRLPPVKVTAPTVSELAPRFSVPPSTVTAPASARVFVAWPRASVPVEIVVPPA